MALAAGVGANRTALVRLARFLASGCDR